MLTGATSLESISGTQTPPIRSSSTLPGSPSKTSLVGLVKGQSRSPIISTISTQIPILMSSASTTSISKIISPSEILKISTSSDIPKSSALPPTTKYSEKISAFTAKLSAEQTGKTSIITTKKSVLKRKSVTSKPPSKTPSETSEKSSETPIEKIKAKPIEQHAQENIYTEEIIEDFN